MIGTERIFDRLHALGNRLYNWRVQNGSWIFKQVFMLCMIGEVKIEGEISFF